MQLIDIIALTPVAEITGIASAELVASRVAELLGCRDVSAVSGIFLDVEVDSVGTRDIELVLESDRDEKLDFVGDSTVMVTVSGGDGVALDRRDVKETPVTEPELLTEPRDEESAFVEVGRVDEKVGFSGVRVGVGGIGVGGINESIPSSESCSSARGWSSSVSVLSEARLFSLLSRTVHRVQPESLCNSEEPGTLS